ncbi:glycosyltransferase family 4 protein [Virgibacillus sp. MSP4-1]|uniref:glycosyltransferase family 4 protein n=1 Tax=Virgibacillus sp. MSP4-1 TaxID=2700081 RepID=UPI00039DA8CE|nr:glycosyltransferase family 1 protein [Virgibacillus sp. MSP4-1]QHS23494.1 glycosyltransferase family 4 protein [Virgibacillus sp. MSP4-1]
MNIYINGRFLTQQVTGVQRYALEVVKALDNLLKNAAIDKDFYKFIILTPGPIKNELELEHVLIETKGKTNGHIWEQFELPFFTSDGLLLNLCNVGPAFKRNQASVIHDAAVFANANNYSFLFKMWYRFILRAQGIFAKKIITVSEFSLKQLVKFLKIKEDKIQVIYEGKEHFTKIPSDNNFIYQKELHVRPYILAVSSLNPNKNFSAIVKATKYIDIDDVDIVIAGGKSSKVFKDSGITLPDNVKHLGYVSDEQLKALYENAFCFVYPSLYEGFGLPPLEAMSVGCPVIISSRASLPEVGGEAALYCNPTHPEDIAKQIEELFKNNKFRSELINKSEAQASKFTWRSTAEQLFHTITKI